MPITLHLNGDNAWPDLRTKAGSADMERIIHLPQANMEIAALEGGMKSGRYSIALRINLPDKRVVVYECSWREFTTAYRGLLAKLGEP